MATWRVATASLKIDVEVSEGARHSAAHHRTPGERAIAPWHTVPAARLTLGNLKHVMDGTEPSWMVAGRWAQRRRYSIISMVIPEATRTAMRSLQR